MSASLCQAADEGIEINLVSKRSARERKLEEGAASQEVFSPRELKTGLVLNLVNLTTLFVLFTTVRARERNHTSYLYQYAVSLEVWTLTSSFALTFISLAERQLAANGNQIPEPFYDFLRFLFTVLPFVGAAIAAYAAM